MIAARPAGTCWGSAAAESRMIAEVISNAGHCRNDRRYVGEDQLPAVRAIGDVGRFYYWRLGLIELPVHDVAGGCLNTRRPARRVIRTMLLVCSKLARRSIGMDRVSFLLVTFTVGLLQVGCYVIDVVGNLGRRQLEPQVGCTRSAMRDSRDPAHRPPLSRAVRYCRSAGRLREQIHRRWHPAGMLSR